MSTKSRGYNNISIDILLFAFYCTSFFAYQYSIRSDNTMSFITSTFLYVTPLWLRSVNDAVHAHHTFFEKINLFIDTLFVLIGLVLFIIALTSLFSLSKDESYVISHNNQIIITVLSGSFLARSLYGLVLEYFKEFSLRSYRKYHRPKMPQ